MSVLKQIQNLQDERDALRRALRDVISSYEYCSADPHDRGWSVLDDAIGAARAIIPSNQE